MSTRKRIALCVARDGEAAREFLVERTVEEQLPIGWIVLDGDGEPDIAWTERCRISIRACDGFIGVIPQRTGIASRQQWAIGCAHEEQKPILLTCVHGEQPDQLSEVFGIHVNVWSWTTIRTFVDGVWYGDRLLR